MTRSLLFTLLALLASIRCASQGALRFTENKGQWPSDVTHRAELGGATVWFEQGALLLDRYDAEAIAVVHGDIRTTLPITVQHHAVRLKFLSALPTTHSTSDLQLPGHTSYFLGNDPRRWASRARSYARVTMHDVAPGCDAIFTEGRSGLKYDLVLAPGADPASIRFTYEGADGLVLRNGALIVNTSLGRLVERIPLAYQEIGNDRVPVSCSYTLSHGVVGVKPGAYDHALPLIIDPTLSFATYSGSFSNNFGYTATFDQAGFLYAGSTAFGAQFPVTTGAYQTIWSGGTTDIAITKYDTTGTFLVWSTYLGGTAAEMPHSLIVGTNDQLLVLGTTGSNDFPITANGYDDSFAAGTSFTPAGLGLSYPNGCDMVIARLDSEGAALLGSTYLGGTGNDGLNSAAALKFNYADEVRGEVLLDTLGRVWVVSCTQSSDAPTTAGCAQGTFGGGTHDGYVARFDALLTQLQFASFVGGTSADATFSGEFDDQGRLYVCGGTTSADLPASSTAVDATYNGGLSDAFAARFNNTGSSIDALTYWGSTTYDQAYFLELDAQGSVYLFGQTTAPSGQLIQNAPYNVPFGGQFITKMDADLSAVLLSSRVGAGDGTPDISPTAFLVDVCDKIYTSGWGSSSGGLGGALTTAGLPVTPGAHQTTTEGHDLYLAVFDIDMTALTYATYYGGSQSPEHVDGGTSRFDRRGRVYQSVCAGCQNHDDFPTSPGAWSATNNSTGCNNGVLKFDFDAPLVIAAFTAADTVCAGAAVDFINLSSGATSYQWDFGDQQSSTAASPTHTYATGTYLVTLTAFDPNSCNGQDQATRTIVVVGVQPTLEAMNDTIVCGPLDSFTLIASSAGSSSSFQWSSDPAFTNTLNATPADSTATLSPVMSGTYYVRADNGARCVTTDSVTITVPLANASITGGSLICAGDTTTLALIGVDAGAFIQWSPADEILSGQNTPTVTVSPDEETTYGANVIGAFGCTWDTTITVSVSPLSGSAVSATATPQLVTPGTSVQLQATPGTGVTYSWQPASLVSNPLLANPTANVQETTTFFVTVSDGICTRTDSVKVNVYDLRCQEPDIFVPNTFTPNGDGTNDTLFVRGRHIERLEFQVFDRWGEKVFETVDQTKGWDGRYGGKHVDPAVFVYHLTAWCVDGQRYFTKGNVTVVR